MNRPRIDVTRLLGSPKRRTGRAVGVAVGIALVTGVLFLGLYGLSMTLAEAGVIKRLVTLEVAAIRNASWSPVSWHLVWFAVLVSLGVATSYLGIRHAERGGGLIGTGALVLAVPAGTALYQWALIEAPHLVGAGLPSGSVAFFQFGYEFVLPWRPHALDVLVGILVVGLAFGVGRFLAGRADGSRTDWLVATTAFTGAFLAGYMEPRPLFPVAEVYPTARHLPYARYGVFYGAVLTVVVLLALRVVRWSARRREGARVSGG